MNTPTNTNHVAVAESHLAAAAAMAPHGLEWSADGTLAAAQVQATIAVGHALLALARHFTANYDGIPLAPKVEV